MPAAYDVFLSHAWADGERPRQLADGLTKAGLRVWFDAKEIDDFASITRAVIEGLAKSKALLAYYSKTYPLRRACQWELTAAFLAAQCEGDPRYRVLVINPEEKSSHIYPIELRDEKYLRAPNDDAEMHTLVEAVRKHVAVVEGALADIHALTAPNWYGMTPVGSTRFVGRLREMWEVHSLLHAGDVAQITGAGVATGGIGQVQGLAGVGKSLLGEEYAIRFSAAYPGGIFWLRAYGNDDAKAGLGLGEREAARVGQVRDIAERLGISVANLSPAAIEGALTRKMESEGKECLWVVDDVPSGLDDQVLRQWFSPHPLARTLLTTRSREYSAQAQALNLDVLARDEAYQLLTWQRSPVSEAEHEQAQLLTEDLGRHALALDVTGSALLSYGGYEPYRKFREELANPDEDALELAKDLADALPNGHEASIAQTMLRSIRGLKAEGQDFLRLASALAVAPIPATLVTAVFEKADGLEPGKAEQSQRQAFHDATKASLAEIAGEKQEARSVHTLVSRTVRFHEKSAPQRIEALRAAAVEVLCAEVAKAAPDPRLHKQIEFHVEHARQLVSLPTDELETDLVDCVAQYDFARGSYASARMLQERNLEFRRRVLGPEHPGTLQSMHSLAETLRVEGDLEGARQLQQETLEICHRVFGPEHPHTLTSMGDLALAMKAQGDLAEGRKLEEEALALRRRVLGPEHPDTLTSINNLAGTLRVQGDLAKARTLQEENITNRRRVLGPEHPHTLTSMNNLAVILQTQRDLPGARKLQEEVLGIRRRVLGPEHPDTLESMGNLAVTLQSQGDLAGARNLQEETLAVDRRVLGPEHPHTLTSMNNLAVILQKQGNLAEARKLQEETLAVYCRVLGPRHPDTLTSMSNLANTLRAQGDLRGARKLYEDTLTLRRRVLGPEHPETSNSALGLFLTVRDLADRLAARAVLERDLRWLLERDPATLGAEHREIREDVVKAVKDHLSAEKKRYRTGASDQGALEQVSRGEKIGRNDPCPCGSGKKYKKCCGA